MKLTIEAISDYVGDGPIYDTAIEAEYTIMPPAQGPGGLFDGEVVGGVRFCVAMVEPDSGFFFSVADIGEDKNECVLIHCPNRNRVGAYFIKSRS